MVHGALRQSIFVGGGMIRFIIPLLFAASTVCAEQKTGNDWFGNPEEVSVHPRMYMEKEVPGSWVLLYTNLLTGGVLETSHSVTVSHDDKDRIISWVINRKPNLPCSAYADQRLPAEECADKIVVSPPDGYLALPSEATVNEEDSMEILIVPEVMG